ncbi:MAG TPA: FAD binding domain-containing protein, partial [Terriglobales bacterium]|nr:FAD binding domain-containing protein [Terriglobales bacterium]
AEVVELLGRFGESAKVYAGGTELLLAMKEGLVQYEHLINVKNLKGLNEVNAQNGMITIGALCTHHRLEGSAVLRDQLPALVKLEENVANVRVRQAGTLGGNLCFAEPHADPGTFLLVLNAIMVAEKSASKREIPAAEFFVDAYETSLAADELLTEIRIPKPKPGTRSAYLKFGYLERPSVGVAIAFELDGSLVSDVKIAVGCAGPAPRRVEEAEARLNGKSVAEAQQALAQAGAIAGRASQAISDLHGSQEYKEHIVGVLLKRAFQSALS